MRLHPHHSVWAVVQVLTEQHNYTRNKTKAYSDLYNNHINNYKTEENWEREKKARIIQEKKRIQEEKGGGKENMRGKMGEKK